ncbi:MAG: hypothetical protein ACI9C9_002843, partial [Marivirga sp.]
MRQQTPNLKSVATSTIHSEWLSMETPFTT